MPLTPETLTRHEFTGLPVRVAAARDAGLIGTTGRVIRESARTVIVRTVSGDKRIPKRGTTFEFAVPADGDVSFVVDPSVAFATSPPERAPTDEAAGPREGPGTASKLPSETAGAASAVAGQSGGCEGVAYVTVDGERLLSRPAYRTERNANRGDNKWQSD